MKYTTVFCFLLLTVFGVSCGQGQKDVVKKIDKHVLENALKGRVQLLDVRTPEEYGAGHIDGALNFNVKDTTTFLQHIENLDKNQPVYVYCKMGGRSAQATQILKEQGFVAIYDYTGGYTDWVKQK